MRGTYCSILRLPSGLRSAWPKSNNTSLSRTIVSLGSKPSSAQATSVRPRKRAENHRKRDRASIVCLLFIKKNFISGERGRGIALTDGKYVSTHVAQALATLPSCVLL